MCVLQNFNLERNSVREESRCPPNCHTHFGPTLGCTHDTAVQAEHTSSRILRKSLIMTAGRTVLSLGARSNSNSDRSTGGSVHVRAGASGTPDILNCNAAAPNRPRIIAAIAGTHARGVEMSTKCVTDFDVTYGSALAPAVSNSPFW